MDTPQLVESLKGKKVVDAACGSSHSACILDDGSLYTWGKGRYGRLGHNDHDPQYKPKQVSCPVQDIIEKMHLKISSLLPIYRSISSLVPIFLANSCMR